MVNQETMIRIKQDVWELIQFEKKLGESMSDTIGRVFQDRFDVYEKVMNDLEEEKEVLK